MELFFKWLKLHLRVKTFWGESENAVRIQIHIAIITYSIIAIIEHDLKIERPVIEVMRILGNSLLVKDSIQELMTSIEKNQELKERDQLELDLDFE